MGLWVHWALEDGDAREGAAAKSTRVMSFCNPADFLRQGLSPPKAATLEQDYWRLDGSFSLFPDNPADTAWGVWGAGLSGSTGSLTLYPTVTVTLSGQHSSAGLTLIFSPYEDNYPSRVQVTWYRDSTRLASVTYKPESWRLVCDKTVTGYNKILIAIRAMQKPGRFARLTGIVFGREMCFGPEALTGAEIWEEVDLSGRSLPEDSFSATVFSEEDAFNILDPEGLFAMLQRRQALTVEGELAGDYQPLGTFYLEDWSQPGPRQFRLRGCDALGVMENTVFAGGMYTNVTGAALLAEIMNDAGFSYTVEAALAQKTVSGWLPRCSHREALRQALFALGGAADSSRSGSLRFFVPSAMAAGQIPLSRKTAENYALTRNTAVTGVQVTGHDYVLGTATETLYAGTLEAGEQAITFSKPARVKGVSGAVLVSSTVNGAVVRVATAGKVTVTGQAYQDNTRMGEARAAVTESGTENLLTVDDATLVSCAEAPLAAARLLAAAGRTLRQETGLWNTAVQVGQQYQTEVAPGVWRAGYVESLSLDGATGEVRAVIVSD